MKRNLSQKKQNPIKTFQNTNRQKIIHIKKNPQREFLKNMIVFLNIIISVICAVATDKPKIENAVIMILCQNKDMAEISRTIEKFELKFNHRYHYPYVFLNDKLFTKKFENEIKSKVSSNVEFGVLNKDEWGYPEWIDQDKARKSMKEMEAKKIIYGGSESYRHMCRFFSGKFYKNELVKKYDYYWRIEPGVDFLCDIEYDPFKYLRTNNLEYGFTIAIREFMSTIPTLWDSTLEFLRENKDIIKNDNSIEMILTKDGNYNGCHFWSNFEIASFKFYRSEIYEKYFEYLDKKGGFYYERWGDAPVHSIAAYLFLGVEKIHFFSDIGYRHDPFQHCPNIPSMESKCDCKPSDSIDFTAFSCLPNYFGDKYSPKTYL